jgi:uncharacterized protein (TIGR01777 family)
MTDTLWVFLFLQMAMGATDTLYHHELTERLAWRPSQQCELKLHAVRNLAYGVTFAAIGWSEPKGWMAAGLLALMASELVITLWDFVEEDRTRRLPASERVLHTVLTLNYGVVLAILCPLLLLWAGQPTALTRAYHGLPSWLCAIAAAGVTYSGLRDFAAAARCSRLRQSAAAPLVEDLQMCRHVLVTGGTGLVGRRLISALVEAGHDVTLLTRSPAKASELPAPIRLVTSLDQIAADTHIDAIVNLAGEPISDGLWSFRKRCRILRSRLRTTRSVVALIRRLEKRPEVLVNASAIGWYGLRGDEILGEQADGIDCFSRSICVRWEKEAMKAAELGVRVVPLRIGLVLAAEGGILSRMLAPFEFFAGGPLGTGRHWMSWIHRDDLVRLIAYALATPSLAGPVNATAPEPVTNRVFVKALGHALHRPAVLPMPAAPLRALLGDFAHELLLSGQRVVPSAALASGFRFRYATIGKALGEIVGGTGRYREAGGQHITRGNCGPSLQEGDERA